MLQSKLKLPTGARGKDLDAYLDRVYQYNKAAIDELDEEGLFGSRIVGEELFKAEIKAKLKAEGKGIEGVGEVIKALGRTELFYSRVDRRVENAINSIKSDAAVYKKLRLAWGWNRKLDWD